MRTHNLLFGSFKFLVPLAGWCVCARHQLTALGPHSKIIVVLPLLLRAVPYIHPKRKTHTNAESGAAGRGSNEKPNPIASHQLTHNVCIYTSQCIPNCENKIKTDGRPKALMRMRAR